jgi:hypothetical protein
VRRSARKQASQEAQAGGSARETGRWTRNAGLCCVCMKRL